MLELVCNGGVRIFANGKSEGTFKAQESPIEVSVLVVFEYVAQAGVRASSCFFTPNFKGVGEY